MAPSKEELDSLEGSLKDLKLTNEEMTKFEKAFKDPEFMKLFEDYAKEVSDPKVKAETDLYLRELEQQGRGEDVYGKGVQLVVPTPAMVLKSKVVGADGVDTGSSGGGGKGGLPVGQKVFINVCTSDKVGRYSLEAARDASGRTGKQLNIPLTLGPKRQGTDKRGDPAAVYDFVVHPDSVEFAASTPAAMASLAETALEQVEGVSRSRLSRGWRRLNYQYKATEGATEPPVQTIRTAEGGDVVGGRLRPNASVPAADVPGAKAGPAAPAQGAAAAGAAGSASSGGAKRSTFSFDKSKPGKTGEAPKLKDPAQFGFRHPDGSVTPEWSLVHRGETDLAASWGDAGKGLALTAQHVPKELVVRVTLPEVASAAEVDLDAGERQLDLKVPGRYRLSVPLPYTVDEAKGKAKFDKGRKQLEIALPVVPPPPPPRPAQGAALSAAAAPDACVEASPEQATAAAVEPSVTTPQCDAESAVGGREEEQRSAEPGGEGAVIATSSPVGESSGAAADAGDAAGGVAQTGPRDPKASAGPVPSAQGGVGSSSSVVSGDEVRCGGSELDMTDNERRWREIHALQAGDHGSGEASGAADVVAASAAAASTTGAAEAPAGEAEAATGAAEATPSQTAASGSLQAGATSATGVPAAAGVAMDAAEPTVMLRPRLRSELVMELE